MLRSLGLLTIMGILWAGCGTIRSAEVFDQSASRLEAVQTAGLEELEPYRVAAARAFLDLAWEARGRGDYDEAMGFARRSLELAEEALRSPRRILQGQPVEAAPGGPR